MNYIQTTAPYLRRKKTTLQIMIDLAIGLGIIWILAIIMSFVKLGSQYGLNAIFLMITALATTAVCDIITTILKNKKDRNLGKIIVHDLIHNYSWITAAIFTLCCPVWTPYYVIIVGSIFSTIIGKNVFGGFGKNIFNPAAAGRLFVLLSFPLKTPSNITTGVDASTGATITNIIQSTQGWLGSDAINGFGVSDLLLGTYFGAMGEVFTIAILLVGVFLAIREVINWRIPLFYLGTIALSALFIGIFLGFNNIGLYVLYHIATGGAMFAAIFMLTDPVTTPTSPLGNCLIGVIAGVLTVLIRVGTNNAEGVVYSIMVINTFSPMIDHFITKKTTKNNIVKSSVTFGSVFISCVLCVVVAWNRNGGREIYTINGMDVKEYYRYIEPLNLNNLTSKEYVIENASSSVQDDYLYTLNLYRLEDGGISETLPEGNNYVKYEYASKYKINTKTGKEIGYLYCVKVTAEIQTKKGTYEKDCIAFVGIEHDTNKLLELSVYKIPATNDKYNEEVYSSLDKVQFTNLTCSEFVSKDASEITTSATNTMRGIQLAVQKAYEVYVKEGK